VKIRAVLPQDEALRFSLLQAASLSPIELLVAGAALLVPALRRGDDAGQIIKVLRLVYDRARSAGHQAEISYLLAGAALQDGHQAAALTALTRFLDLHSAPRQSAEAKILAAQAALAEAE
jgi:hypothetical protein